MSNTLNKLSIDQLQQNDDFKSRHIGPDATEQQAMLDLLGLTSLDALIDKVVPESIRMK